MLSASSSPSGATPLHPPAVLLQRSRMSSGSRRADPICSSRLTACRSQFLSEPLASCTILCPAQRGFIVSNRVGTVVNGHLDIGSPLENRGIFRAAGESFPNFSNSLRCVAGLLEQF